MSRRPVPNSIEDPNIPVSDRLVGLLEFHAIENGYEDQTTEWASQPDEVARLVESSSAALHAVISEEQVIDALHKVAEIRSAGK